MNIKSAERLQKLPPYLFAALRKKIAAKKEAGVEVISLGIGDPDQPTPDPVIDKLTGTIRDTADINRHRYGCDVPVNELNCAIIAFYQKQYQVKLQPEQVVPTMGSKDAIVKLCLGILNPGDLGIAPVPGYPTYNIGHVFASATTFQVPLLAENNFLVDFQAIPHEVRRQAKILWLNYPNNPTTATATLEFFQEAVDFAREHNILLAHDAAYSANTFDNYKAPSILEIPGAEEVAVEFFSLSKAFNMTGWRSGFAAGNLSALNALQTVKDNIDNGCLRAIQWASAEALNRADELLPAINSIYQRRRDLVVTALNKAGWPVEKPDATIYIWAPVPEKYKGLSGVFAEDLLEKAGVVVTPGASYGQWGEGFYRISLTYPDDLLKEALERIAKMAQ